ncbi:MAG: hypothetical protein WCV63_05935 [Negativicutes bacterium]
MKYYQKGVFLWLKNLPFSLVNFTCALLMKFMFVKKCQTGEYRPNPDELHFVEPIGRKLFIIILLILFSYLSVLIDLVFIKESIVFDTSVYLNLTLITITILIQNFQILFLEYGNENTRSLSILKESMLIITLVLILMCVMLLVFYKLALFYVLVTLLFFSILASTFLNIFTSLRDKGAGALSNDFSKSTQDLAQQAQCFQQNQGVEKL